MHIFRLCTTESAFNFEPKGDLKAILHRVLWSYVTIIYIFERWMSVMCISKRVVDSTMLNIQSGSEAKSTLGKFCNDVHLNSKGTYLP